MSSHTALHLTRAKTPIQEISVSAYTIPTDEPESDGTMKWDKTTLILVEAAAGDHTGIGYSYADRSAAYLIHRVLSHEVRGQDAFDIPHIWLKMVARVRNIGRPGIASMAIAAVDNALWDLKARLLGVSMTRLLGSRREAITAYGSGGFTSYSIEKLQEQLGGWVNQGFKQVKMKVGRHPERDLERVRAARDAIGPDADLFVDANGAYSRKQALMMADLFSSCEVSWFEEPVSSDDLEGLRLIRDRAPSEMMIAAGEYGFDSVYFRRMLEAGAVDALQADATRCCGITGFLQAAALCEAHMIPISGHTAPSLHVPLLRAAEKGLNLEYFHDHVRIENLLFDGVPQPRNGELRPDPDRPGLGLELKRQDAERFAA